jgi:transcriptional regulator with XRE-family HTH domain
MSYLSTALTRLAELHDLRQADFVRDAGLTRSHVSRIFSGAQRVITDADFIAISKVFARQPEAQAELVAARCMDARVGPAADRVEIRVKGGAAKNADRSELPMVKLPHDVERALEWLRGQCPLNPGLARHLVGYAKLTGMT